MQPLLRTSLAIRKTVLESVPIISSIDDNRNFHFRINPSEYFFLNPRSLVVDIELSIVKANGEKLSGPHADELTERMMAMILQAKSDYVQYKEQYRSWRSRQQQQADSSSSSSRQKRAIPRTPSKTPRGRGRGSQTASRTNRRRRSRNNSRQSKTMLKLAEREAQQVTLPAPAYCKPVVAVIRCSRLLVRYPPHERVQQVGGARRR